MEPTYKVVKPDAVSDKIRIRKVSFRGQARVGWAVTSSAEDSADTSISLYQGVVYVARACSSPHGDCPGYQIHRTVVPLSEVSQIWLAEEPAAVNKEVTCSFGGCPSVFSRSSLRPDEELYRYMAAYDWQEVGHGWHCPEHKEQSKALPPPPPPQVEQNSSKRGPGRPPKNTLKAAAPRDTLAKEGSNDVTNFHTETCPAGCKGSGVLWLPSKEGEEGQSIACPGTGGAPSGV